MSSTYDDVSQFGPDGKVKPLDYIKGSIEMGGTAVALKSSKGGVIVCNSTNKKKVFKIGENSLFCFSGITNDGLSIVDYLLLEDTWEEVYKKRSIDGRHVFDHFSVDASLRTMYNRNRMFGAAGILLTVNQINNNIDLVEWIPTGLCNNVLGCAIGHRAQSARTILEDAEFGSMSVEELVTIGISAVKNAHNEEDEITLEIWVVDEHGIRQIN